MYSTVIVLLALDATLKLLAHWREKATCCDDITKAETLDVQHREFDEKRQAFRRKMSDKGEISFEIASG